MRQLINFGRGFLLWSEALDKAPDSSELIAELDRRVSSLGNDLGWELGPGSSASNGLALSPDGDLERLSTTQYVVSRAPSIPGWEFLPARPVRNPCLQFLLATATRGEIAIDAAGWRYTLLLFQAS